MLPLLVVTALVGIAGAIDCQHAVASKRGWVASTEQVDDITLTLAIKLNHAAIGDLKSHTEALSIDDNARREATQALEPSADSIGNVTAWLRSAGAEPQIAGASFIRVTLTPQQSRALMPGASFVRFTNQISKRTITRSTTVPSLPPQVALHLDATEGLCDFPQPRRPLAHLRRLRTAGIAPGVDVSRVYAGEQLINATVCFNTSLKSTQGVKPSALQVQGSQDSRQWSTTVALAPHNASCLQASAGCCVVAVPGAEDFMSTSISARLAVGGAWSPWVDYLSAVVPQPLATPDKVRELCHVPACLYATHTTPSHKVRELYHVPPEAIGGRVKSNFMSVLE